jgi:hypothetical protein
MGNINNDPLLSATMCRDLTSLMSSKAPLLAPYELKLSIREAEIDLYFANNDFPMPGTWQVFTIC